MNISNTFTSVEITYKNTPNRGWCNIDKNTYIVVNDQSYTMISATGINVDPEKTSFSQVGEELTFTLYFPAIPLSATKMDLIENETSEWRFYGISLSNQVSNDNLASTKRNAEAGNAVSQFDLGICYFNGQGVSQDYSQALYWLSKAAEQGNAVAQFDLGICYLSGQGVSQDYSQAASWFRKAAEQGNAEAQLGIAGCYYYGNGVSQDYSQAASWFRKAAEQGNAEAQLYLAGCYYSGNGVSRDYSQAVKWYKKAAEQGDAEAQERLALCYYLGNGVSQDHSQAVYWLSKAAEQGNATAQFALSAFYYSGDGVAQDHSQAVFWLSKAAEQGDAGAQFRLGGLYAMGVGVTKNKVESMKWYTKAAEQGYTPENNTYVRTINNPSVSRTSDSQIKINSVVLNSSYTAVQLTNNNVKPAGAYAWCNIDKNTYIIVDGQRFTMTRAEGIKVAPSKTYFSRVGEEITFTLYFPAIPYNSTKMDLIENATSPWRFYGISLN